MANEALRMKWILDTEILLFTEKPDYIEKRICFEDV